MAALLALLALASGLQTASAAARVLQKARYARPPYGITAWVKMNTNNIRAVSAATSSYIVEGTLQVAWEDDSLFASANDGDSYADNVNPCAGQTPAIPACTPATGLSSIYTSAVAAASAASNNPPAMPPPSLNNAMVVQARLGGSSSEVWQVSYGPPAWLTSGTKSQAFAPFETNHPASSDLNLCYNKCPSGICPNACPSTWVTGQITYTALQVGQPQQLKNFPMDTQFLNLALVNRAATNALTGRDVLFRFTDDSLATALPLAGDPDGYTIASVALGNATTPEGFGSIQVQWTIKRIPDFFINRFVLPLSLVTIGVIMLMSANPASRAMASFTMMGTVVSFLFVSGQSVPQLPYRTRLDNYFTLHFFMAFVMGLWNVYSTNRIDRVKVDPTESFYTLCGLLAPAAKAPEKKKDDGADKKDDAVALAINAPSGSALEVAVAEQTGVLRRLLAKTEEEAKKNDEVKATAKKDKDNEKARAASALHNDQMFTLLLLGTYVLIVPCLFYL